jgi:hypothetical protein
MEILQLLWSRRCPLVNVPQRNCHLFSASLAELNSQLYGSAKRQLRPTVSRPVCLGIKRPSRLTTRFLLLSDSCGFVDVGRSLWWEDGSVVYNYSWPSPAQSFSGPKPMGLVIIFYCLTFETSLFVASYDSQGYGGGIRPRIHTGV